MRPTPTGLAVIGLSLTAGLGALYLLQYLYRQREKSGAIWFMGNIASVALLCFCYGVSLLVFDPTVRAVFEAVTFVAVVFMGPFFLAFGLGYTGRADLIRTPLFGIVMAVPTLTIPIALTNPVHGLVWTDFALSPVFGLATVNYTISPWGVFSVLFCVGTAAIGSLLLVGTIVSYGPLYRQEATAVILSTAPPTVGVLLWLFEIGPYPELHLTAPLMVVHVALDSYAFVGTHMFETNPATQRAAEQNGLDALTDPVFVLDAENGIVRVNDAAERAFPGVEFDTFPIPLRSVVGVGLVELRERGEITVGDRHGRTFAASHAPLTDSNGGAVGSMLVFYDLTEERQRKQQLAVLNRVLRHNLRNETTIIGGYAGMLTSDLDDPRHVEYARAIATASDELHSIGEKARKFERLQERELRPIDLAVTDLLDDVAEACLDAHDDATVERTVDPPDLHVRADPETVSTLLTNLVENAIVHTESAAPTVRVRATESSDGETVFEVRDDNEPIPDIEIESVRAGDETALQHGQGIGLWIAFWSATKLDGRIEFGYDDGNVVTVTLP